jgi:lysophospholipase L1-like esterase
VFTRDLAGCDPHTGRTTQQRLVASRGDPGEGGEILRCRVRKVNALHCALLAVMSVTIACAQDSGAQGATDGSQPIHRSDKNSRIAHLLLLDKARRGGIDVYFEGDSITRRWGTSDAAYRDLLEHWTRSFSGWNAANFGWGGDTVQNILWRLNEGELDGVHPKVIVLMAGTNNVGRTPREGVDAAVVESVANGMGAVLDLMRSKAPEATVILMGITPRTDSRGGASVMPTIATINERYAQFADGRRIRYVNINAQLSRADGAPRDGATVDGLHLSLAGYQVWADALKPIFTELLGPPAATDRAPPPTGDTSATAPPNGDPSAASTRSPTRLNSACSSGPRGRRRAAARRAHRQPGQH